MDRKCSRSSSQRSASCASGRCDRKLKEVETLDTTRRKDERVEVSCERCLANGIGKRKGGVGGVKVQENARPTT